MGVHHALRPAGGARGVVDGDRRGLILDFPGPRVLRRRGGPIGIGFDPTVRGVQFARRSVFVRVDDDGLDPARRAGVDDRLEEARIAEEELHLTVAEDVVDLGWGQARVEHDEHTAGQRHRVVGDERLGAVRREHGDGVTVGQSAAFEPFGQALDGVGHLPVGEAPGTVDDRFPLGVGFERPLEEAQRRQGGVQSGHDQSPHRRRHRLRL